MKSLFLKKGFERRVQTGYLWIFSNEVENLKDFVPGELAKIFTHTKDFVGIGYVNPHSLICARILSKKDTKIDIDFVKNRITTALSLRKKLYNKPYYRLLFSEGDFFPGVIIDRYDNIFSIQLNTFWADKNKDLIITALKEIFSNNINIVLKNDNNARLLETLPLSVESLNSEFNGDIFFEENEIKMYVNILKGQKTGYYFDQRENKKLMQFVAKDSYVIDVFSYIGGWGLNALKNGAKKVTFVDISAFPLECAEENVKLNKFKAETEFIKMDAIDFLKNLAQSNEKPDVLVIDPPAFVKSKKKLNEALKGYINLNKWALKSVKKNGFIFTCSCSQHVDEEKFHWILNNAAKTAGKKFKILSKLSQGFDHPVNPKMKETFYLKGFFIQVL
ncbi:class I SAM-dependent rRNA methyltransferase [Deferribacter autotrophicus]|uniref:Class I SAM-dependent rRNA methyltransferase n=1 Tax=Deferribacter autotrophicus TaxID=500465 RepID=A0A5A8EZG0_9BACT|nr:class I SAM-dependent rRNA methyltransferase [Deferribacter autotrophicus]KAA0257070.1 class I SAM-dependent rRNA methyltransferase [Deferribacter autotrophicus]